MTFSINKLLADIEIQYQWGLGDNENHYQKGASLKLTITIN